MCFMVSPLVQTSSLGSGAGSNKLVGNPGTGGVIQRRARPRPNDCTLPAAASASSARCTVRGLAPSAIASAELDHDSPSASKASTSACSSSTGGASTTTSLARRGDSAKPRFVALTSASVRSSARSRPISTRNRARCDSSACLPPEGARDQRFPRHVAGPRFSQRASQCEQHRTRRERNHRVPGHARHCGRHPPPAPPTPAALRPLQAGAGAPRHARSGAPRACSATRDALSTSAVSAGISASRAARSARASAARAVLIRSRRIAMPATTSSWPARDAGGNDVGIEPGERMLGLIEAADQEQAPDLEIAAHARH